MDDDRTNTTDGIEPGATVTVETVGEVKGRVKKHGKWWYHVELAGGENVELRESEVEK